MLCLKNSSNEQYFAGGHPFRAGMCTYYMQSFDSSNNCVRMFPHVGDVLFVLTSKYSNSNHHPSVCLSARIQLYHPCRVRSDRRYVSKLSTRQKGMLLPQQFAKKRNVNFSEDKLSTRFCSFLPLLLPLLRFYHKFERVPRWMAATADSPDQTFISQSWSPIVRRFYVVEKRHSTDLRHKNL